VATPFKIDECLGSCHLAYTACIGLTGVSIKTGNYAKVLEANVTTLQADLSNCLNAKNQYNSDLETCNMNLQNKVSSLTICQTDRNNLSDKLSVCTRDLTKCEDNYDDLNIKFQKKSEDLDKCKDDLDRARAIKTVCSQASTS
jgi:chromosome segregation ATPase